MYTMITVMHVLQHPYARVPRVWHEPGLLYFHGYLFLRCSPAMSSGIPSKKRFCIVLLYSTRGYSIPVRQNISLSARVFDILAGNTRGYTRGRWIPAQHWFEPTSSSVVVLFQYTHSWAIDFAVKSTSRLGNIFRENGCRSRDFCQTKPKVFHISWSYIYEAWKTSWVALYIACTEKLRLLWRTSRTEMFTKSPPYHIC